MAIGNLTQYRKNVKEGRSVRYKNPVKRRKSSKSKKPSPTKDLVISKDTGLSVRKDIEAAKPKTSSSKTNTLAKNRGFQQKIQMEPTRTRLYDDFNQANTLNTQQSFDRSNYQPATLKTIKDLKGNVRGYEDTLNKQSVRGNFQENNILQAEDQRQSLFEPRKTTNTKPTPPRLFGGDLSLSKTPRNTIALFPSGLQRGKNTWWEGLSEFSRRNVAKLDASKQSKFTKATVGTGLRTTEGLGELTGGLAALFQKQTYKAIGSELMTSRGLPSVGKGLRNVEPDLRKSFFGALTLVGPELAMGSKLAAGARISNTARKNIFELELASSASSQNLRASGKIGDMWKPITKAEFELPSSTSWILDEKGLRTGTKQKVLIGENIGYNLGKESQTTLLRDSTLTKNDLLDFKLDSVTEPAVKAFDKQQQALRNTKLEFANDKVQIFSVAPWDKPTFKGYLDSPTTTKPSMQTTFGDSGLSLASKNDKGLTLTLFSEKTTAVPKSKSLFSMNKKGSLGGGQKLLFENPSLRLPESKRGFFDSRTNLFDNKRTMSIYKDITPSIPALSLSSTGNLGVLSSPSRTVSSPTSNTLLQAAKIKPIAERENKLDKPLVDIFSETKTSLENKDLMKLKQIGRTDTKTKLKTIPSLGKGKGGLKTDTLLKTVPELALKQNLALTAKAVTKTISRAKTKYRPLDQELARLRTLPLSFRKSSKSFGSKSLFNLQIGKSGNKIFEEYRGLSLDLAASKGLSRLSKSAAASLKITTSEGKSLDPFQEKTVRGFLGNRFSKNKQGRYIQKNKYRISSLGEKREISLLGGKKKSFGLTKNKGTYDKATKLLGKGFSLRKTRDLLK